jgi:hypothetical protein
MERPTTEHLLVVKRLLRYVAGTTQVGCFYKTRKEKKLMRLLGIATAILWATLTPTRAPLDFFSW